MAGLDPSEPGKEEDTGTEGIVEIRRSAREIGRIKWEDQQHPRSMAGAKVDRASEADYADHHLDQMRLQACTLVSTTVIMSRLDSSQTETTALLQQVLTMLQQGTVRQLSRSLSMHSQVEPPGFNSQTTRVGNHPAYWYMLTGIIFRLWPIQLHPLLPSPYYPLTPPFHMIVSSFG